METSLPHDLALGPSGQRAQTRSLAACGGAREGGRRHLRRTGGHHVGDLRAGAGALPAQVRANPGPGCGGRGGQGWTLVVPGEDPPIPLPRNPRFQTTGREKPGGRARGFSSRGESPRPLRTPPPRFEKAFLESGAVSEPHVCASINACEELRWVCPAVPGATGRGRASPGNYDADSAPVAPWWPCPEASGGDSVSVLGPAPSPPPPVGSSLGPAELRPWQGRRELQG